MATQTSAVTADELLRMPNDGARYELLRGEVTRRAPAGQRHGRIAMNLLTSLDGSVRAQRLGVVYAAETGFLLASAPDTVRAPDVAFVSRERLARRDSNNRMHRAYSRSPLAETGPLPYTMT